MKSAHSSHSSHFTNALMIAVLGGIVDIAARQDRIERMGKRVMTTTERIEKVVDSLSDNFDIIKNNSQKAVTLGQETLGDLGELKDDIANGVPAETVLEKLEALTGKGQDSVAASSAALAAAQAGADVVPETTPTPDPAPAEPTDPAPAPEEPATPAEPTDTTGTEPTA